MKPLQRPSLLVLAALLGLQMASAADLSGLYDPSVLEQSREPLQRTTTKIFDMAVWPALTSEQLRLLGGEKPPLEFPPWGEKEARGHPLAFYVPSGRRSIVVPMLSLKFLDDLCTAYAWLQVNGYGVETVSEYTAILRYGEPPPGGFPPPLEALGIPPDARDDPVVDELALGHSVTARAFILFHELGHIAHGHHARTLEESRRNEQQADRFALDALPNTGLPPIGAVVFFMAGAHWAAYPPSGNDTHPLDGARLRALADAVDDPEQQKLFRDLGELLDDPDIRTGFAATGKAGNLAALAPRRPGALPQLASDKADSGGSVAFNGVYRGELVQFPSAAPIPVELHLERSGQRVRGSYSFGLGLGTLEGVVENDRLRFEWRWASNYGQGALRSEGVDAFSGTWGYREDSTGAGTWTGRRVKHP